MLALLRSVLISGLLSGILTAQASPPAVPVSHLDSLYQHETGDTAAIRAIYKTSTAPAAAPERMHAASWMSVYLLHEDPGAALAWAEQALTIAGVAGLDTLDYRLAPAYHTMGWLGNEGYGAPDMARRGLQIAPRGDHLEYRLYSQLAALLVLECDPFVLVALDSARQKLQSFDEETRIAELYGSNLYEKAHFLHQCQENFRGSAEVYEVMIGYYAKHLDDPENVKAWLVAKACLGLLLAELQNLPEAKKIMLELDRINIDSIELATYDYAIVQDALSVVAEALGQTEKAVTYQQKTLDYYRRNEHLTMGYEFVESNLQLFTTSMATDNDERTFGYMADYRKLVEIPESRYYLDMSALLYKTGRYQASLDTAYLALRQACLDCAEGELPTATNTIRNQVWQKRMTAQLYFHAARALDKLGQTSGNEVSYLRKAAQLEDNLFSFFDAAEQDEQGLFGESAMIFTEYKTAALNAAAARHARLEVLTGSPAEREATFRMIESGKSSIAKQQLNPTIFPAATVEENRTYLRKIRTKEIALATLPKAELAAVRDEYIATTEAYHRFRKNLRAAYPEMVATQKEQRNTTLGSLQATLRADEVFLHYVKTITKYDNSKLLVQVVTTGRVTTKEVSIPANLDDLIAEYQLLLQSPLQAQRRKRQRFVELSHRLYEVLVMPVRDALEGKSRLIVSPDKTLYYVPFESLVETATPAAYADLPYLIKRFTISYHFSATDFVAARPAGAELVGVAAFAPVFATGVKLAPGAVAQRFLTDTLLRGLSGGVLEPLPATRREVTNIATIYGPEATTVEVDSSANREALLRMLAGDYRVIHIATHGFVNEYNYGLSALACYDAGDASPNFVYAYDIHNQDLKAELVILSSCESGIGREVSGEGLLSLNRALIHAGARNVISTLWKIDDRFSSEFMTTLHRIMATGVPYAVALREAKIKMLSKPATSSPRFWAPFILVGS